MPTLCSRCSCYKHVTCLSQTPACHGNQYAIIFLEACISCNDVTPLHVCAQTIPHCHAVVNRVVGIGVRVHTHWNFQCWIHKNSSSIEHYYCWPSTEIRGWEKRKRLCDCKHFYSCLLKMIISLFIPLSLLLTVSCSLAFIPRFTSHWLQFIILGLTAPTD